MRLLLARKLIGVSSAAEPLPAQRRRRPCLSEMHSQQNQMRCIRRRRPSASAIRDRSSWSLVTTRSSRARAPTTTEASITSGVEARAHAFPDARDRASLRSSMRQPRRRRDSGAWGPPRHACPSTPAGTTGRWPRARARACRAHVSRRFASAARSAPVSYVRLMRLLIAGGPLPIGRVSRRQPPTPLR